MSPIPTPTSSDDDLVRSIAGGDANALARAYDAFGGWVHGLAQRIVGNATEAEEVVQDVFVQLWRSASRFDPARGNLHGWLVAVTRSRAIDLLRRRRSQPPASGELDASAVAAPGTGPAEALSLGDARASAVAAMGSLPAEERRVLELAYFDGLTQTQIAERTGTPLGTVKGRARNALARLRAALPRSLGGER